MRFQKISSSILALLMIFVITVPVAAADNVASVTVDGTTTYYTTLSSAWTKANASIGATLTLLSDQTYQATYNVTSADMTLFEEMISLVSVYVIDTATIEAATECGTIFWTAEQFEALTEAPSVENFGDSTKITGFNAYQSTDGQWYSAAPAVAPKDMAETEYYILGYVIHTDGTVSYSGVMSYTFEQYISNMATNAKMGEFAQRLYYYERAAKAALK